MIVATLSIVIVSLPMGAEAIPLVGPIAQCIQGCTRSLSTLTPGYCMNICGAEYHPLTNPIQDTHQKHHVQVEHHHEHHVHFEHHHEHRHEHHHVQVEHHHEHHVQVEHHPEQPIDHGVN
ncbi:histidine-rich glycoprotein-like isoform X2 [Cucumis melo var. makuwa]|nr:histidine-rich glycoprotein-like isoform X2 [Cucumis melo var. makuwa]TYK20266.1 histidine-rich glycoprotein-like isoform X2 [Cucumis melo var. makuwa]